MIRLGSLALGVVAGAIAVRRLRRARAAMAPAALAASARDYVTSFVAEVRIGMAEREAELREAFGLPAGGAAEGPRTPAKG